MDDIPTEQAMGLVKELDKQGSHSMILFRLKLYNQS
jgi:hypothetical protein